MAFLRDALTALQLKVEIWAPESGKQKSAKFFLEKEVSINPYLLHDKKDLKDANPAVLRLLLEIFKLLKIFSL